MHSEDNLPTASFPGERFVCPDCQAEVRLPGDPTVSVTCAACGRVISATELVLAASSTDSGRRDTTHRSTQAYTPDEEDGSAAPSMPDVPGYEILRVLGRGGMGIVYLAREAALNRLVALKMLRRGRDFDAAGFSGRVKRFRREAEAIARLHHPNIVQIFAIAECPAGPFFTMEYLEHGSLARRIRGKPQEPRQAAHIVSQLASAIHAAHAHGIVHRDLKPANILLQGSPNSLSHSTPKIADFGLAKDLERDFGQTHAGGILGTPSYMAPEQAAADGESLGPLVDVYALGAILYELLTGRPPFRGKTALETVELVRTTEPVAPSRLQRGVGDLETICLKCLEKNPARRYGSAQELGDDLHAFLNGEPIRARPVGQFERTWKLIKRRPALAGLIAVTCAALLGTAGFLVRDYLQSQEYVAALQSENAKTERARKTAVERAIRQTVATGLKYQQEGDLLTGMLYFTEAALLEDPDSPALAQHRLRLGAGLLQCPRLVQLWTHEKAITHVAFNPTVPQAVSASSDGVVRAIQIDRGLPMFENDLRHTGPVNHVAFSADGARLATAGDDTTARVWDAATGKPLGEPLPHRYPVLEVAFAPRADGALMTLCGSRLATISPGTIPGAPTMRPIVTGVNAKGIPQYSYIPTPGPSIPTTVQPRGVVMLWPDLNAKKATWQAAFTGWINHAEFSPNGKHVVTAGSSASGVNAAQVWELGSPKSVAAVKYPSGVHVHWTAFSPDGKRIVAASGRIEGGTGEAQVWNALTGEAVGPPLKHPGAVTFAAFSPDGKRLLTVAGDGAARLWNAVSGEPLIAPVRHRDVLSRAAFSPDGLRFLTASWDGAVCIWNASTGEQVAPALKHPSPITAACFHPTRPLVLTGCQDGSVRLWDLATPVFTKQVFRQRELLPPPVTDTIMAHSGKQTLFVSKVLPGLIATSVRFSPDGQNLISTAGARTLDQVPGGGEAQSEIRFRTNHLCVWNVAAGELAWQPQAHGSPVSNTLLSGKGELLIAKHSTQPFAKDSLTSAEVLEIGSGRLVAAAPLEAGEAVRAMGFDGTQRPLVLAQKPMKAPESRLRILNAADGKEIASPWLTPNEVTQATFSDDGRLLALLAKQRPTANAKPPVAGKGTPAPMEKVEPSKNVLEVRDLQTDGKLFASIILPIEANRIVFGPRGGMVGAYRFEIVQSDLPVNVPQEVQAYFYDLAKSEGHILSHKGPILAMAFSPGGQRVATASADRSARVWETATGKPVTPPLEHHGKVLDVAFAGEDRLATASLDHTACLWDLANGELLTPALRHPAGVVSVALDKEGRRLATACLDGAARIWDLAAAELTLAEIKDALEITSGHRVDATQGLSAFDVSSVRERWTKQTQRSLAAPDLARAWHRELLDEGQLEGNLHAQLLHLNELIVAEPNNRDFHVRRGRVLAALPGVD